jgi:hypothetical protein
MKKNSMIWIAAGVAGILIWKFYVTDIKDRIGEKLS